MYQVLYRKWRPQTFEDVIGQEPITTTLKNQVAEGRLSHAYLFCGSRGTGKTTCSKILAKAVNCLNPQAGNPCNACEICKGIDNESILDITEIDAASNSGVDNIRELREEANFTPVSATYRVYIIDETHMLSTGAFNALLKIMEEPPPHVLFILATTEIHKVPATVLSRCQRFDFRRISSTIMAEFLLTLAKRETLLLTPDAAALIARLSDGSVRDSLSLLDLCMAGLGEGNEITASLVEGKVGLAGQHYLHELATHALHEDSGKALGVLYSLWEYSVDYQQFCQQLLAYYRNLLLIQSVPNPSEFIDATPKELDAMTEVAKGYTVNRIFYAIRTLSEALARMSQTSMRKTEMELGILTLCRPDMDTSKEALLLRIEKLEAMPRTMIVPAALPTPESSTPEKPSVSPTDSSTDSPTSTPAPEMDSRTPVEPFADWGDVLSVIRVKNHALFGTLFSSTAYITGDLLLVDSGSDLFAEMVRHDEYARDSLREAAQQVTGKTYRLGPYTAESFTVTETINALDTLEETAKELGIPLDITQ